MTTPITGKVFDTAQMMPDEIEYMVERVKQLKDGLMVEWGSGGSTEIWINSLSAGSELISIEHNRQWYNNVMQLHSVYHDKKFTTSYVDVSSPYFEHGYGDVFEETPFNVAEYIFPEPKVYDADIYFIDGIVRGACLAGILLNGTKPNAEIYIHDYRERTMAYEWITQFRTVELVGTTLAKIS